MAFSKHQYTNMYECDTAEEVVAYPTRLSIKLIVCKLNSSGDQIKITDDISASPGEDTTTDDVIAHVYGHANNDMVVIPFVPPIHVFGLNIAAISSSSCKAFIYLA